MALDFRERSSFRLMPAQIVSRDSSTWWNTIRINRGFEDGVEADMPAVTEYGRRGRPLTV
jgi:rod shape-determining protein MreC